MIDAIKEKEIHQAGVTVLKRCRICLLLGTALVNISYQS